MQRQNNVHTSTLAQIAALANGNLSNGNIVSASYDARNRFSTLNVPGPSRPARQPARE